MSLSTTKSEYVATTHSMKEMLWLHRLLGNIFTPIQGLTMLFLDNQSAIALTKDHQYHPRTKHIDVCYHFICWVVEKGSRQLVYCPIADMVADVLTKALPSVKVKHFMACLGLHCIWGAVLKLKYVTHLTKKHLYSYVVRGSMLQMQVCPISFLIILSFIYRHYLIATCLFSMYQAAAPTCYLSSFPALLCMHLKQVHLLYIALFIASQLGGWKFTFL
jgi:hypothetical protein